MRNGTMGGGPAAAEWGVGWRPLGGVDMAAGAMTGDVVRLPSTSRSPPDPAARA